MDSHRQPKGLTSGQAKRRAAVLDEPPADTPEERATQDECKARYRKALDNRDAKKAKLSSLVKVHNAVPSPCLSDQKRKRRARKDLFQTGAKLQTTESGNHTPLEPTRQPERGILKKRPLQHGSDQAQYFEGLLKSLAEYAETIEAALQKRRGGAQLKEALRFQKSEIAAQIKEAEESLKEAKRLSE